MTTTLPPNSMSDGLRQRRRTSTSQKPIAEKASQKSLEEKKYDTLYESCDSTNGHVSRVRSRCNDNENDDVAVTAANNKPTLLGSISDKSKTLASLHDNNNDNDDDDNNNNNAAVVISLVIGILITCLNISYLIKLRNDSHSTTSTTRSVRVLDLHPNTKNRNPREAKTIIQKERNNENDKHHPNNNIDQQCNGVEGCAAAVDDNANNGYYIDSPQYDPHASQRFKSLQRRDYTNGAASTKGYSDDCVPMYEWQLSHHPVCNMLHELHMSHSTLDYIDMGTATVVYEILGTNLVLKTPIFDESMVDINEESKNRDDVDEDDSDDDDEDDGRGGDDEERWLQKEKDRLETEVPNYVPSDYEIRRLEAVIHERLSSSPYIAKMYAFCGMSFIAPFASEGTLHDLIASVRSGGAEPTSIQKLKIGIQIAEGMAALHGIGSDAGGDHRPSFAHNDVDVNQLVYVDGIFQLNDFNFGFMLLQHADTYETCYGESYMSPWKYRAPEDFDYGYGNGPYALEKADVYMMCNELYIVLTNQWLFEDHTRDGAIELILDGYRPIIPEKYWILESGTGTIDDQAHHAMVYAISEMCWHDEPDERATAREIADYLQGQLYRILDKEEVEEDKAKYDEDEEDCSYGRLKQDGVVRVSIPPLAEDIIDDYNDFM